MYVLGKSIESFLGYVFSPFIVKKFLNFFCNIDNIYDLLDFAFSFQAFGVSVNIKYRSLYEKLREAEDYAILFIQSSFFLLFY